LSVAGSGPDDGPAENEETYTVTQAAKILRVTDRAVRKWLGDGTLEGGQDASGRWHIPQRAVHTRMEDRPARPREDASEAPGATQRADELLGVVRDLERRLGRAEARAELTERAESTLRDQLRREQERADQSELEVRKLRAALEEARKPEHPWWRRLFGG